MARAAAGADHHQGDGLVLDDGLSKRASNSPSGTLLSPGMPGGVFIGARHIDQHGFSRLMSCTALATVRPPAAPLSMGTPAGPWKRGPERSYQFSTMNFTLFLGCKQRNFRMTGFDPLSRETMQQTRSDPPRRIHLEPGNRFTGWTDVDLTPTGVSQAMSAGKLLKGRRLRV